MAIGPFRPQWSPSRPPSDELRRVERRAFVNAPPRAVWAALHNPANMGRLFPELTLGPADPGWPAAATVRSGRARLGLLREDATVESLEARPLASFRFRLTGRAFQSEWRWRLEARAGGTRVAHDAILQPDDKLADWLIRLGRDSLAERVEAHLRALKDVAEAAWAEDLDARRGSRLA